MAVTLTTSCNDLVITMALPTEVLEGRRCTATTLAGTPCKQFSMWGSDKCVSHTYRRRGCIIPYNSSAPSTPLTRGAALAQQKWWLPSGYARGLRPICRCGLVVSKRRRDAGKSHPIPHRLGSRGCAYSTMPNEVDDALIISISPRPGASWVVVADDTPPVPDR